MDPITIIVSALAAGAAAGLKPKAEQAVKDAYNGLKALILHKYGKLSVDALEQKPESKAKRSSVAEDLSDWRVFMNEMLGKISMFYYMAIPFPRQTYDIM